jgi:Uma2 family endonuclease
MHARKPSAPAATYADIVALPPNIVGEIAFGVLHTHPRPTPRHGIASSVLGSELMAPYRFGRGGPGGWVFIDEPELHLQDHVLVPDIAGWRRERMLALPETAWFETPPDWVCEVLSPSTQAFDRTVKLGIYAAFDVGHAWYVDPVAQTLEVLARQNDGRWLIAATFKDADPVSAPPFEAHTFPLDVLWSVG